MKKKLQELGLSKNESLIYMSLLRNGSSSVGKISEDSGIHRRNIYDAIEKLENRGFVCQDATGKSKLFRITSPTTLLNMIEEEKEILRLRESKANSLISDMLSMRRGSDEKMKIFVHKGVKGVRSVFEDILNTGEENRALGVHKPPGIIANYIENFHKRRVKMGLKDMLIFNNDFDRGKKLAQMKHTEVRFTPKEQERSTSINIYDNKVAIFSWGEPVSIII